MSLDLFFRAETPATLRTVVRSQAFRNIIGDLTYRDEDGNIITSQIRQIAGSVDWVYFKPNDYVGDGQGGVDSWCWLHLRLTGPAEEADLDGANDQPDRWDRSRLKRWMKENGILRTIRGVRVWQYTLGNGKRIQIWRGAQMEALGVKFHEFLGGNEH